MVTNGRAGGISRVLAQSLERGLSAREGSRKQFVLRIVVAILLAAASAAAVVAGVVGRPLPSKYSTTDTQLWTAFGPGAVSADSSLWYALAVTAAVLCVAAVVIAARPGRPFSAPWVPVLVTALAWVAALGLIVARWMRGDRYANYLPADFDAVRYIGAIVLILLVFVLIGFLRVFRFRSRRRPARAND